VGRHNSLGVALHIAVAAAAGERRRNSALVDLVPVEDSGILVGTPYYLAAVDCEGRGQWKRQSTLMEPVLVTRLLPHCSFVGVADVVEWIANLEATWRAWECEGPVKVLVEVAAAAEERR
jgi:hypothetical protein